jgi:hypothetical protein
MSTDDQQPTPASALKPIAVPVPEAQRLCGDKCRSSLYDAIARGELEAVKDGAKTLITLESIERRQANLPPAKIKPLPPPAKIKPPSPPRSHRRQKR